MHQSLVTFNFAKITNSHSSFNQKLPTFLWKAKKGLVQFTNFGLTKIEATFRTERYRNSEIRKLKNYTYSRAKIKVIGIGGAGNNVLDLFISKKINYNKNVDYLAINTDEQALRKLSNKCRTFQLGNTGLGSGSDLKVAQNFAEKQSKQIINELKGFNLIILVAGIGKGTGSGATPIIAKYAKELNIPVVSLVFYPQTQFLSENKINEFKDALSRIKYNSSSVAVYNNNHFYVDNLDQKTSFDLANQSLIDGLESIVNLSGRLYEEIDSNDFIKVMKEGKRFCFYSMEVNSNNIDQLNHKLEESLKIYQIEKSKINRFLIFFDFGLKRVTNKFCADISGAINQFLKSQKNINQNDFSFGFYDNKISDKIRINIMMCEPIEINFMEPDSKTKTQKIDYNWNQQNVQTARNVSRNSSVVPVRSVPASQVRREINLKNDNSKNNTDFVFESITKMFHQSHTKSVQSQQNKYKA